MAKKNNSGYLSARESRKISKANRKITGLHTLRAAAVSPGGECAAKLLQKMQQLDNGDQ